MRNEFDKQEERSINYNIEQRSRNNVIILDEESTMGVDKRRRFYGYIELRLDQEYGYVLNIIQGEFEMYDFELLDQENQINILQIQ